MSGNEKFSSTPVATSSSADPLFEHRHWLSVGILESFAIHRFRNLLMAMMGNVSLIRDELKNGRTPEKFLDDLDRTLSDAAQYSTWIQSFVEKQKPLLTLSNLNDCVREAVEAATHSDLPSNLQITFLSCEQMPEFMLDPLLLKLCIWELISEYTSAAREKILTQKPSESLSLMIEVKSGSKTIGTNGSSKKDQRFAEVGFKSSNLSITLNPACSPVPGGKKSICSTPAIEVSKFIVKLFHGELTVTTAADHEEISLFFPLPAERK